MMPPWEGKALFQIHSDNGAAPASRGRGEIFRIPSHVWGVISASFSQREFLGLFPELPPRWFEMGAPISWARVINHPARPATGAGAKGAPGLPSLKKGRGCGAPPSGESPVSAFRSAHQMA